ncbi:GTP-binding protein [Aminipila butyrica]|uniref:GTP-binding protein n=1 Tax=Aminipila butyrica TaxID=433296 RepID=A0A858BUK3_9FIRM|nr:TetM/TetW/TetO/TetS family tetracycline resistance ribosomal protection protein [Aminipila butyrica]QIB68755.1 GTP-binding protein [Aminipila butyrica]
MKKLVVGILAHVDAGKTTLSESMLYLTGKIGKLGRVDNKDAYLDTYELERARGITIFAKQALLSWGDVQVTLLDTPGHVDFSAEMERTLQVLDYAILVVNGADGVQGHTKTLWNLLDYYGIPVFLFVNKMDQPGADQEALLRNLKKRLDDRCIDFGASAQLSWQEEVALCGEKLMEEYLEQSSVSKEAVRRAIWERQLFPCYFGSALRAEGVRELLEGISVYAMEPEYPADFGARIFNITRDDQGNRLTHLKVTGGRLKVRDLLSGGDWSEKVNQIRLYSGLKFEVENEVQAGTVCAVTGLSETRPGQGLGIEEEWGPPLLEPVLSYRLLLPADCDPRVLLPKLRQLEEEQPELRISWEEPSQEIQVQLMGEVQTEILQSTVASRFGVEIGFHPGRMVYKETIAHPVEGVGHFEPLRHYAEVHLLMEPAEPGSGLHFATACSEDLLSRNWQRLVLTHLAEKSHRGVLTGSPITDMRITLVSGRAHNKHTEGGDFRQATYRAVRQGLKEAESVLLEPFYAFQLELPENMVGRAMTDVETMAGTCQVERTDGELTLLTGKAPVATMKNYQKEVAAYTKGQGKLFCTLSGFEPCHNSQEVIADMGYDSESDLENPTGSVFCAQGSGYLVSWNQVKDHMNLESYLRQPGQEGGTGAQAVYGGSGEQWISPDEIDTIFRQTFFANQGRKSVWKRTRGPREEAFGASGGTFGSNSRPGNGLNPAGYGSLQKDDREEYLLVDGYNVIFAWEDLKELAEVNMDSARMKLIDCLSNYQALRPWRIILVFDAYRVQGHREETVDYHNVRVVYTKEAQPADQYIERFAYDNQKKYRITVATSDGLQQVIIRGAGCGLLSARELKEDVEAASRQLRQKHRQLLEQRADALGDYLSPEEKQKLEKLLEEEYQ